jgi:hypothetical protein
MTETLPRMATLPPALERVAETGELGIYRLRWDRIPPAP